MQRGSNAGATFTMDCRARLSMHSFYRWLQEHRAETDRSLAHRAEIFTLRIKNFQAIVRRVQRI